MRSISASLRWMGAAFAASALAAVLALAATGAGEHGTVLALKLTARLAFVLFWPAYAGPGLARLLGAGSALLKRHGRDMGLAFAAAMLVHAGLIVRLCWIGAAPARGVFFTFAPPLVLVYLLALFSLPRLQQALGRAGWRGLRLVGMNAIAVAFALDFLRAPLFDSPLHAAEYAPFAVLCVLGFALQAVSLLPRALGRRQAAG